MAKILKKTNNAMHTTVSYLQNVNSDLKARETLKDSELIRQFKEVEALPESEKNTVMKFIEAYIREFKTRQAYT